MSARAFRRCSDKFGGFQCALQAGHLGHHKLAQSDVQLAFDWAGGPSASREFIAESARKFLGFEPSADWVEAAFQALKK